MIRNKEGQERVSVAVVYVDRPIDLSGRIARGVHTAPDPTAPGITSYEPQAVQEMVLLDGTTLGWKVYL